MKLTARLFDDLVVAKMATKADIGFRAGQILHLNEGVFRVEAKTFGPTGSQLRLASVGGTNVLSIQAKDLQPFSPLDVRIAGFVRLAFNADFDLYVKEIVRDHGFPVDEGMDWSRWWEAKTRNRFSYAGEELRDEAVHNLIIWALLDKDKLAEFDPEKLNENIKSLPLEKQVTSYLQGIFDNRLDYIYDYINNATGKGKEFSGESTEDDEVGTLNRAEGKEDSAYEVHEEAEEQKLFRDFRTSFFTWLDSNESGFQKRSIEPMKVLFDLIIISDDPKPRFIAESFVDLTGASKSSMRGYTEKLADALVRFSQKAPAGVINLPLINKLKSLAPSKASSLSKDASSQESPMSLETKLAKLKAKHTPKPPAPKVDKFAKLRRIAEEEPEAMGEALGELTVAFATLADAADALAENLDLVNPETDTEEEVVPNDTPAKKEARKKAKQARVKNFKFASALKKIALENPGSLADALVEVYSTLDTVAEGIENLASNLGIELAVEPAMDDMGMGLPGDDMGMDMGLDTPPVDPALDAPPTGDLDMSAEVDADINSALPEGVTPDGDLAPKASSRRPFGTRARR